MDADKRQKRPKEKVEQFGWLVTARYKSGGLLHMLYACNLKLKGHKETEILNQREKEVFYLLVGVAFSLWRAAPLAEKTRTRPDITTAADKILERLVKDNAVAYTQDYESRYWMEGYYFNNAKYRLQHTEEKMKNEPHWDLSHFDFKKLKPGISTNDSYFDYWDLLFDFTQRLFDTFFRERFSSFNLSDSI